MKKARKPSEASSRRVSSGKGYDPSVYDKVLGSVFRYVRKQRRKISLSKAGQLSGISRQFWAKFEKGDSSVSTETEVHMCNALRVRPSVMHRLAERWIEKTVNGMAILLGGSPFGDLLFAESAWGM